MRGVLIDIFSCRRGKTFASSIPLLAFGDDLFIQRCDKNLVSEILHFVRRNDSVGCDELPRLDCSAFAWLIRRAKGLGSPAVDQQSTSITFYQEFEKPSRSPKEKQTPRG